MIHNTLTKMALLTLLALPLTATSATAQRFGIRVGDRDRGVGIRVSDHGVRVGINLGGRDHRDHRGHDEHRGHRHNDGCRRWVEGCWRTIEERVWVEGACRQVWCPPVYETRYDACGRRIQVCVSHGFYKTVQEPGYFRTVCRRVQDPGHWEYVCGR